MSKYQSEVKIIPASQYQVWNRISDLSQFQTMKDNMSPEMKEALKAKIAEQGGGKIPALVHGTGRKQFVKQIHL